MNLSSIQTSLSPPPSSLRLFVGFYPPFSLSFRVLSSMAAGTLISNFPSISISFSSSLVLSTSRPLLYSCRPLSLHHFSALTPLSADVIRRSGAVASPIRCFTTRRPTTSSLNDPSPNWSNRPPKETILLDGCDFEHWLIVMEPPHPNLTRDEIIDSYIKTLARVLGSEEEARKSIYSVSTKHYFAFGCVVSEELSYKIKPLPKVRWVLPDSYLDVKNKSYGGEPFIDGKAVPYDPIYHEEYVRNNARANERSRRNDRPRNFDRSRNFERRRENMQSRDFQNRDGPPPMPNKEFHNHIGANQMLPPRPGGDMPRPPLNQVFQNNQGNFNSMPLIGAPPKNGPPSPEYSNMLNPGYQNQMPNPQSGYTPGMQGGPGYQEGSPGYQGGGY